MGDKETPRAPAAPGASAAVAPAPPTSEYHIVDHVSAVRGESVWVSWLGYPKSRNTWRSLRTHFANSTSSCSSASSLDAYGQFLAAQPRVKLSVRHLPAAEVPVGGSVLQGRKPQARDIRAVLALPKPAVERSDSNLRAGGGRAAKRQKRKDYETQVHVIRVAGDGTISETRGVKKAGLGIVPISEIVSRPGSSAALSSTRGRRRGLQAGRRR